MSSIEKQNDEFNALNELILAYNIHNKVAVVDYDYPQVRYNYELAIRNFLNACAINRPDDVQRALFDANVWED